MKKKRAKCPACGKVLTVTVAGRFCKPCLYADRQRKRLRKLEEY